MSGCPNPSGVKNLHQACKDFMLTREQVAELERSIANDQETLKTRRDELRLSKALIEGELSKMDVDAPGNYGWEQRYFELLLMMSQII